MVGGLLLQTTRKSVTKSCGGRFAKFTTACSDTSVIYDEVTGDVVVQPATTGGLLPYGVDAVFLESSSAYDVTLSTGQTLGFMLAVKSWMFRVLDHRSVLHLLDVDSAFKIVIDYA